jgi:hypothetical protein
VAGAEQERRAALAAEGDEEDVRRGDPILDGRRDLGCSLSAAAAGPQEIEVLVYFPAGVDMQCWASIFWSWICKWDLKASI